jgi:hypothetical protein
MMAYGQAQRGAITVTVAAEDGSRLPGVVVEAASDSTLTKRTTVTDETGIANLTALDPANNYVVSTSLDGFNGSRNENVLVRAGQTTDIRVTLSLATVTEEVIVTAESPVVDVTSAVAGQEITLELTEALPTARSYQDYLQLVPGVQDAISGSNPASRSGINYSDIGGTQGSSSDNFYYFEGVNVTDNVTGTFGANLNTEIIQEQSVLTGGLPAEFVGATGLVSNVITKSGGNQFSGSVNYYIQNDSLVADNKNDPGGKFDTYDTAATFGGPIVKDKAWFFASFRNVNRKDDVARNNVVLRTVENDAKQSFAKITWALTQSDLISGLYLSDPQDISGSRDPDILNTRVFAREQGGDRYGFNYSRVWSSLVFDAAYSNHSGDLNDLPAPGFGNLSRNSITFVRGAPSTAETSQLGGYGFQLFDTRSNDAIKASLEYLAATSWGDHTIKGGAEFTTNENVRNNLTINDASYTSLAGIFAGGGVTAADISDSGSIVDFDHNNASDNRGLNVSIQALPAAQRNAILAALDTNRDGVVSPDEAGNIVFGRANGETGDGSIFYDRTAQTIDGIQVTNSEGTTYYLQDQWQWGKFSANVGVRAEKWEHFDTEGRNIYTFPEEYAPRVSLTYDIKGDGRHRLSAYYGKYYDPIRNNMTNFAGSVTGRVREEQVYIDVPGFSDWVTYRIRGGAVQPDAFFAPSTQTPYTEELTVGYKVDLGRNQTFEINYIDRKTSDILEDYDLGVYSTAAGYGLPVNDPDSLFLPLSYFGYNDVPISNFVIATLAGGTREWDGVELIFRKRMSNHWQLLSSYNYADAKGNSNSDSNADFQGDVLWLDPRAPNQYGTQPGLVEHLFKVAGSYQWDNGFQIGGKYRWNSGVIASRTFRASGRNLPLFDVFDNGTLPGNSTPVDPILFAGGDGFGDPGIAGFWLSPFSVGAVDNPSYGIFDLRFAYLWRVGGRWEADFFLDVFNVLDEQDATSTQDLARGNVDPAFGEGLTFVDPRRYFLGARLRF